MAHHELHAGLARRVDHAPAVLEGQRHRLLHQNVLAVLRRKAGMLGVERVGCGDIDHVYVGATELFHRWKEFPFEGNLARIRRRHELHARVAEGGRHHLEGAPETGDPYSQPAHRG